MGHPLTSFQSIIFLCFFLWAPSTRGSCRARARVPNRSSTEIQTPISWASRRNFPRKKSGRINSTMPPVIIPGQGLQRKLRSTQHMGGGRAPPHVKFIDMGCGSAPRRRRGGAVNWFFLVFFGFLWFSLVFFGFLWFLLVFLVFLVFLAFFGIFGIFWSFLVDQIFK